MRYSNMLRSFAEGLVAVRTETGAEITLRNETMEGRTGRIAETTADRLSRVVTDHFRQNSWVGAAFTKLVVFEDAPHDFDDGRNSFHFRPAHTRALNLSTPLQERVSLQAVAMSKQGYQVSGLERLLPCTV